MKKTKKRLVQIKDRIEADRIEIAEIFQKAERDLDGLSPGQISGQAGIELAELMDELFAVDAFLAKAQKRMELLISV